MSDEAPICITCKQVHAAYDGKGRPCKGHIKGKPCRRHCCKDQDVCPRHGGLTPQAKAGAMVRSEEREARKMLVKRLESPEPIQHPVYELLSLAAELREWQSLLRERVGELSELTQEDMMGVDRERALVTLYTRALDQNAKLLVDMAKLDLATRSLRLQQSAAQDVMEAVAMAIKRAGLAEHEDRIRAELAAALREKSLTPAIAVANAQGDETPAR